QRRVCQAVYLRVGDRELIVANLHATNNPELAQVEAGLAAEFVRGAERCLLCGDFNVPRFAVPGFSPPLAGIDQILVRGLTLKRGPEPWPAERRRVGELLLSDHAPVEALLWWNLAPSQPCLPSSCATRTCMLVPMARCLVALPRSWWLR